jgi:hypothetical protein
VDFFLARFLSALSKCAHGGCFFVFSMSYTYSYVVPFVVRPVPGEFFLKNKHGFESREKADMIEMKKKKSPRTALPAHETLHVLWQTSPKA